MSGQQWFRIKVSPTYFLNHPVQNINWSIRYGHAEAVARSCFLKKWFLKISQNSEENTCARASFFNKVAGLRSATVLKKRPRCFQFILQRIFEQLFYRTPPVAASVQIFITLVNSFSVLKSNNLVVRLLDYHARGLGLKTSGLLQCGEAFHSSDLGQMTTKSSGT